MWYPYLGKRGGYEDKKAVCYGIGDDGYNHLAGVF